MYYHPSWSDTGFTAYLSMMMQSYYNTFTDEKNSKFLNLSDDCTEGWELKRLEIFIRLRIKLLFASGSTEIILLSFVLARKFRSLFIHGHLTDRINSHYFSSVYSHCSLAGKRYFRRLSPSISKGSTLIVQNIILYYYGPSYCNPLVTISSRSRD